VTLYLFSLPFTLVKELGWATVPIITVVSFTFMGIEGIAEKIEMPFGKHVCCRYVVYKLMGLCIGLDEADLPLGGSTFKLADSVLIRCMVHRSLLRRLKGRDPVSHDLSFSSVRPFLKFIIVISSKSSLRVA
jgi:Bestrophin, RFP-TM, chloride channel